MNTDASVVTSALQLREWAAHCIWNDVEQAPPEASPPAWRLFLEEERCAATLSERFERIDLLRGVSAAAAQEIAAASSREVMHALSARANIRMLARLSVQHGWSPVVLKGGADIARGETVAVADLDVWLPEPDAQRLWSVLRKEGFTAPTPATAHHLPTSRCVGGIPIEVHHAVHRGALPDAELEGYSHPLGGCEPLRALHPAEHAWLLLVEAVFVHPERRFRLRDLRLIARALERCDSAARDRLDRRISASGAAPLFEQVVHSATAPHAVNTGYRRYYMFRNRSRTSPRGNASRTVWRRAALIAAEGSLAGWRRVQGDEAAPNHPLALRIALHMAATVVSMAVVRGTPGDIPSFAPDFSRPGN